MAEREVFMDTNVFTEIVDEIKGTAASCILPDRAINNALAWKSTNVGREILEILGEIHKTADIYKAEASENLPRGLFTLRDSMIAVDNAASESLTVRNNQGGTKIEQKR